MHQLATWIIGTISPSIDPPLLLQLNTQFYPEMHFFTDLLKSILDTIFTQIIDPRDCARHAMSTSRQARNLTYYSGSMENQIDTVARMVHHRNVAISCVEL